jgi:hypothetical protein
MSSSLLKGNTLPVITAAGDVSGGHRPEVIVNNASDITIGQFDQGNAGSQAWLVTGSTTDGGTTWTATKMTTNSADMTTAANVSAAPTSGQKLVLTDLVISTDTAMNVTLKEETTHTVLAGPYYLPANGTIQITPRSRYLKTATVDKHIQAVASLAGNLTIECWTFSEA